MMFVIQTRPDSLEIERSWLRKTIVRSVCTPCAPIILVDSANKQKKGQFWRLAIG